MIKCKVTLRVASFRQEAKVSTETLYPEGNPSMKKHLFVVLVLATVVGVGLIALAADPPVSSKPPAATSNVLATEPKVAAFTGTPLLNEDGTPSSTKINTEFNEPSRSPAEMYARMDPAFSKYVDLSLLAQAMAGPDASLLADVALAIAEGERVLVRNHRSGLNSEDLMARAVKLAARTGDKATLDRVSRASTLGNKPQWAKLVAETKEFAGVSRDGPMVAIGKIDSYSVDLKNDIEKLCDVAAVAGNRAELEHYKKLVAESKIPATIKKHLSDLLDNALKETPEKPKVEDEVLREFTAASRGHNRGKREAEIRARFDWVVFDGEFSAASVAAYALESYFLGGQITRDQLTQCAQKMGIDVARKMIENGFDPNHDVIYSGLMTFNNWQDLPFGNELALPNKFVPYVAVKRRGGGGNGGGQINPIARNEFRYSGGKFVSQGQGRWVEVRDQGPQSVFSQTLATADYIEIYDQSRSMYVRLWNNVGVHSQNRTQWFRWPGSEGSWIR